ncbi:phosphatidylinositol-specific phospholipase C1-like protein [Silvibacterium acidisoli]|uniref:phosphatidylinositol-specific phospholipase C1-like protein n=1 Tax=Acidobacteriaceae bacterium ZG23-2 TaxID=2883246 RepID=UPI00406C734C
MAKAEWMQQACAIALCVAAGTAMAAAPNDDNVRMNQIQVIGTHNSYHAGFAPSAAKMWKEKNPKVYEGLNYSHPSLTAQLDGGVRQLEIDVFADTKGGLFAHPYGQEMLAQSGLPADPPFDPDHVMDKPGFKVMHVQDIDYRSRCEPFTACLAEVRKWSKAHPHHLPVFLLIETKRGKLKVNFPTVTPEEWTPETFDALDKEIRSVFPESELITPDDVRGKYATLNEAILAGKWPTLKEARGKVVFLMDQRNAEPIYTEGHPSLKGRVLFTNAVPGAPDAAFTEQNDGTPEEIDALVKQGYLVRTRSDEPGKQAPVNDTSRRDVVLKTGAQIISTDYPAAEKAPSGYEVELPGNAVARCNPVLKPNGCTDSDLAAKH